MSYNKQNFVNGQPLTAQQLNYMENGLVQLNAELDNVNTEITNIEDNYATKDFVRSEINNAEIGGDGELDVDLSIYALKTEIPKYIQTGALSDSTIGYNATVEGASNIASGDYSHAEGVNNKAIGSHSHAEGANTQATEVGAHAEGSNSSATGGSSHAEGNYTEASGKYSHAEGYGAKASGVYSHAEGVGTIAAGDYQHVQGMFNKEDTTSQYAFIVGNGYSLDDSLENAERSNAYTLDWDGNAWFAGAINCEDKTTTLANLGAAPDGFGLGGAELKAWADVNSVVKPGFYKFNDCEINGGIAAMIVHASDDWTLAQELITFSYPTRKYTRSCHGGSWREWENDALKPYPVGAIYMSLDATSPAELFGGTWERILQRFLFAAHDAAGYPSGATGGEATHTLTIDEMPSHNHEVPHTPLAVADQAFTWGSENLRGAGASHWTKERGGNQPHNNMPPYLCVYMWKRTA